MDLNYADYLTTNGAKSIIMSIGQHIDSLRNTLINYFTQPGDNESVQHKMRRSGVPEDIIN